jgi:signal transduction histidine kinase
MTDRSPESEHRPLPFRQFRWWLWFWHVLYAGMLVFILGEALWEARAALGWRELALTGLVAAQITLYVVIVARSKSWPVPGWKLAVYFLGSLAIWYLEWQLHENFFWIVMSYMGQMYGILPPYFSVPGATAIYALVVAYSVGWNFSRLAPGEVFGMFMGWLSITMSLLLINYLMRTSAERGHLIVGLKAAQKELEASRQRDAELAALRERERLARDLHDSLGHALVTLSVQLEAVQRLYRVDPERASTQIDELKTLTRKSTDDLRRSLDGLRAPALEDRPLREALQALCAETGRRINVKIDCQIDESVNGLGPALAETIWRVAQEALANIGRHAHARNVVLSLQVQAGAVMLRVADDGLGMPPGAEHRHGHYGLRGMRERVEGLGGTLRVAGGAGTTVEARIPTIAEPPAGARPDPSATSCE